LRRTVVIVVVVLGGLAITRIFFWPLVGTRLVPAGIVAAGLVGYAAIASSLGAKPSSRLATVAKDAGVALLTGAILASVIYRVEESRVDRERRGDNVRFVREVVTQPDPSTKPFAGLDLQDAELAGLNLSSADLAGAILTDAILTDADLTSAYLNDAELADPANLTDADLHFANLTGAYLTGVDFRSADLSFAQLFDACLDGANLQGANLEGADLRGADLGAAIVTGAQLTGATLISANFGAAYLGGTSLVRANLSGADLSTANGLSDALLTDVIYDSETDWPPPTEFKPPPPSQLDPSHDDRDKPIKRPDDCYERGQQYRQRAGVSSRSTQ
jgi:uncharacterized protein YjbI with pentapeptide repeats